jgi:hypothetical protein
MWPSSAYLMILCAQVMSKAGWRVMAAGEAVVKRFDTLNSQWLIRGQLAPCGLQIFDLQYVRAAPRMVHCNDGEYRNQTKAEEKDFPAQ